MFDIRLRLANDNGEKGRVLDTLKISWTGAGSASPMLTFTVAEPVVGQLAFPFLVMVEYSTGGEWKRPRNDLFVVDKESADNVDPSGAVSFTAPGFIPWLMQRYALWWRPGDRADGTRPYTNATPGAVLHDMISWAKSYLGWGTQVTLAFMNTADTNQAPWTQRVSMSWPLFTTPLTRVMQTLSEQGYIEWWTEGLHLRVANPGTGTDHSADVVLGGGGFEKAPSSRVSDPTTHLLVQGDFGWTHFENPGADKRFGTLIKVMTQSGAATRADAERSAQPALAEGRALQEELSYDWSPVDGMPAPWADFNIGDTVTARTRRGKKVLRVVSLVVTKDGGKVTARAVVGSKILDLQAKLAKRASAASVGQIIGGSGAAIPAAPTPPNIAPLAPSGVNVAANVASWGDDRTERAAVTIAWSKVEQAADGSSVDVDLYEVWSRLANQQSSLLTATTELSTVVDTWTPGETRYVKVRARSRSGTWSDWSTEIAVTPARPASIVPKAPTGLAIASNTGAFAADGSATSTVRVTWAAVTQSVEGAAATVEAYRAELEDGSAWVPLTEGTAREATFTVPAGKTRRVRARARTALGVWGDPSTALSVAGANPTQVTTAATAPVLATGMGLVTIAWDGKLAGGGNPPTSFQLLYAETAPASTGPWTRTSGAPARAAGQVATVKGTAGADVFARFVWLDTLGRVASTSAVSSIKVVSVIGSDIDKTITDALDQAGQKATAAGQTAEKAVQDALSAKEAAGTAQTAAEAARDSAIAAARNAENKVVNGTFERGAEGWDLSGLTIDPTGGREGSAAATTTGTGTALQPAVNVAAGQRWRLEFWYLTDSTQASGTLNGGLRLQRWNGTAWADAAITTTTVVGEWTRQSVDYVVPDGVTRIRARMAWAYSGGARLWFDDVRLTDVTQVVALETAAKAAQDKADKAERDAAAAQSKADQAASAASAAQGKADSAATAAAAAQSSADAAIANAKTAKDAADVAAARASALLASAENKIADPSMSQGQWAPVAGWTVATDKGRTDSTSMTIGGRASSTTTVILSVPGTNTAITLPVEPGQTFEVGGWYCTSADWNGSSSNSKMRLANQTGGLIGPSNGISAVREEWTRTSGRYTVPANGSVTGLRLNLVSDHTEGRVWWDDFFLRDITAAVKAEADAATAAEAARVAQAAADAAARAAADALAKAGTAQQTADTAVASASGRNALYHDTTGPSGQGTRAGDIWHQWSSMAVNGRLLATWRWTGSAWAKTQLDETYIPLLNIGAGTYGSLRGDRLEANTVSTEKLLVGNISNLVADPALLLPVGQAYTSVVGSDANWSIVNTTGLPGRALTMKATSSTGQHRLKSRERVQVNPGEKYAIAARARVSLTSGSRPLIRLVWRTSTGAFIANSGSVLIGGTGSAWDTTSGIFAVPDDATVATAEWEIEVPASFVGEVWVGNPVWRAAATAQVIVDGDITGRHVAARSFTGEHMQLGSLTVDLVEPSFGEQLRLEANSSVQIIVNQQGSLRDEISQAREDVSATATQAKQAQQAASGAQAAADVANNNLGKLQDQHAATRADLNALQTYFWVDERGAHVGRSDSPFQTHVLADRFEITENGVVQASFAASVMTTQRAEIDQLLVGKHKIEAYGNGTVIRQV